MSGPPIRLFTDEQIDVALAPALRSHGHDAESCHEAGRANRSISDEEQLRYATAQGRAILTFNVADFYQLDADWKVAGVAHCGIIVSPECIDVGLLLPRVLTHLATYDASYQHDRVLWLP